MMLRGEFLMDRSKKIENCDTAKDVSRRKFIGSIALGGGMVAAGALTGCGTSSLKSYSLSEQTKLIQTAINGFAAKYPTAPTQPVNVGAITPVTSDNLSTIVAQLSDPTQVYVSTGDTGTPKSLVAVPLSSSPGFSASDLAAYQAYIKSIVTTSTNVTQTTWTVNGKTFTSLLVSDSTGLLFHSYLSTLAIEITDGKSVGCLGKTISNGLGQTAIRFEVVSTAKCISGTLQSPYSYTSSYTVFFKGIWFAGLNVRSSKIPNTQCQKVEYSYAYSSPNNRVYLTDDAFTLAVHFGAGSGGPGTGACIECCTTGGGGNTP